LTLSMQSFSCNASNGFSDDFAMFLSSCFA
jgi:hypothetical protein